MNTVNSKTYLLLLYRFDHYQMGSSVIISVYAKLCDPEKSFVEANCTCVSTLLITTIYCHDPPETSMC